MIEERAWDLEIEVWFSLCLLLAVGSQVSYYSKHMCSVWPMVLCRTSFSCYQIVLSRPCCGRALDPGQSPLQSVTVDKVGRSEANESLETYGD